MLLIVSRLNVTVPSLCERMLIVRCTTRIEYFKCTDYISWYWLVFAKPFWSDASTSV